MEQSAHEVANWQYYFAIAVFLVTYGFIISEKLNRAVIALFGAAIMIIFGIVDLHTAFTSHIQWETITLLIGMMILVHITSQSGVFEFVAIKAAKAAGGKPIRILLLLSLLTAVGSAFLDNVTTVLLIVPVTLSITRILKVNPIPYLLSEVLFSNIGGTATLIGDPPNIMIGSTNKHLDFNAFLLNLAPIVIIISIVTLGIIYFMYRNKLKTTPEQIEKLMALNEKDYIKDQSLLLKSISILGLTILGFVLHSIIHVDAAVIAMTGATLLMLIGVKEHDIEDVFTHVEWVTIFFFAGLFVLVGGLIDIGLISSLAKEVIGVTNGDIGFAAILILWVSGIASATIDNIPFVATMIPLIQDLATGLGLSVDSPQIEVLWWALSLGACLGGNGTLIGASANVVVAGIAKREGHAFSYMDFLKIGLPLTIIALLLSHAYIYLRYLM
ncbi:MULTISPECIES: ArsB/NhaD family transporter [Bacillus cereus group]|uniref:ArsB/NhaD family transporter n=1 Tax=Bacillus cereus group TaxID=86661 RepID=UPI0022DF3CA7|nr:MULTISPECIES: ArsB/NhaD family transporter [unclassified Bacillus cereus group]MDA2664346.1 ArsB/NhaD family transporter [Bacillus cereus group sp. Bc032]MDA2675064.1 ArsB/NhaD family transporter [Bacillus cereus group sp. Bc031]MDA2680433.1 ArsB/NhaD family transporter [Bacillus cereus group sp. Bc029]MDA2686002.1 ArsB/NhaD family transporter [Bacillus cereus group sp. Bc030]MDA2741460.1 ArsB/NhaD family transporter [Bacillus cereus group sp. Bc011]